MKELWVGKNRDKGPVLVDDEDYVWLVGCELPIEIHYTGYARMHFHIEGVNKRKELHRVIMRYHGILSEDLHVVDHINADRLDNRKENLRCVSHKENMGNTKKAREKRHLLALGEITEDYERCSMCKMWLPRDRFYPSAPKQCKECLKAYQSERGWNKKKDDFKHSAIPTLPMTKKRFKAFKSLVNFIDTNNRIPAFNGKTQQERYLRINLNQWCCIGGAGYVQEIHEWAISNGYCNTKDVTNV